MVKVKIDYCQKNKGNTYGEVKKSNHGFFLDRKNFLVFILASLVCLSGIVYVYQINKTATMGYEMKEREEKIAKLKEENRKMEIESAQFRSIHMVYAGQADENSQSDEAKENGDAVKKEEKQDDLTQDFFGDEVLRKMSKPESVSFMEVEVEKNVAMN